MVESSPVFVDGFGRRVVRVSRDDAPVELLHIDSALAEHPGFVDALRERVAKVAGLRLTSYARTHRLETDGHGGATLVSEYVKGWRLADLLDVAETENLTFDIGVVMLLLRQLLPTAAMLSNQSRDTASGALGPEHLLLTPQGRVVLTDYVLGPAIGTLGWSPERLWSSLRVATPPGSGERAVSPRGDIAQVGVTMLSLVVGRRLRDDEFPERLQLLVDSARQRTPTVVDAPLSEGLRTWVTRALQLHDRSFASVFDARLALEQLLATETTLLAQPMELDLAMSRLERLMPAFELPEPPPPVAAPNLLDMPAPTHNWTLDAVAFDKPSKPRDGGVVAPMVAASAAAVAVAEPPPAPAIAPMPAIAARVGEAEAAPAQAITFAAAPAAPVVPVAGLAVEDFVAAAAAIRPPAAVVEEPAALPVPDLAPAIRRDAPVRVRFGADEPSSPEEVPAPIEAAVPLWRSARVVAAMAAVVLLQGLLLAWLLTRPSESLTGQGELVVHSRPEGAKVTIDDEDRGVTPLTIRIAPGTHVLQLRVGTAEPRVIPLMIHAGVQTAQYVEMQGVASTGVLEVRSEPSSARVTIDGQARGSTPVTLRDVAPGDHQVVLERAGWKSTQTVRVEPGGTAKLVVPIR
jgi:hypothetical protein